MDVAIIYSPPPLWLWIGLWEIYCHNEENLSSFTKFFGTTDSPILLLLLLFLFLFPWLWQYTCMHAYDICIHMHYMAWHMALHWGGSFLRCFSNTLSCLTNMRFDIAIINIFLLMVIQINQMPSSNLAFHIQFEQRHLDIIRLEWTSITKFLALKGV